MHKLLVFLVTTVGKVKARGSISLASPEPIEFH